VLQFDKTKEWPSIVGEHFSSPQPKFDFTILGISFEGGTGYINYRALSLTIPPEHLQITQVSEVTDRYFQLVLFVVNENIRPSEKAVFVN